MSKLITNITGLAQLLQDTKREQERALEKKYDRDAICEALIAKLDKTYTLVYADYRDQFDTETVAKFINSNDPSVLDESIEEWLYDSRGLGADNVINDTFDDDEKAAIDLLELRPELHMEIEQRDDSDPIRDMLRNSHAHFCYVPILEAETEGCIEASQYSDDHQAEYKKIANAAGLDPVTDRKAIIELYENGATYATASLVWFFLLDPVDYYDAKMAQYKTGKEDIEVTLHKPHLAFRDSWNGSGHVVETMRTITVPLSSIRSDEKGNGYSLGVDVCGLVRAPFECGFTFEKEEKDEHHCDSFCNSKSGCPKA